MNAHFNETGLHFPYGDNKNDKSKAITKFLHNTVKIHTGQIVTTTG